MGNGCAIAAVSVPPAELPWDRVLQAGFERLLLFFVFITIFLPSGTIYGLNLKLPVYAALLPLAMYCLFARKQATAARLGTVLALPALLTVWLIVGLAHGFAIAGTIRQYTDIVLTLALCWLALLFCEASDRNRLRFVRLVLFGEVCASLLKAGMIVYALVRGIPVPEVVLTVSRIFGVTLMTMDLGALFGRVQFVSDALIPICVYLLLRHRDRLGIGAWRAAGTLLLLLVSVAFSFSRFFWAYTAFALLLGMLLGRKDRFKLLLLGVLTLAAVASLPLLSMLFELRTSDAVSGSSDQERAEQKQALQDFFVQAPLVGHGLGSYTPVVIRATESEAGRYSYEMQLLALSGQVGILGMALFATVLAWYYRRLWLPGTLAVKDRVALGLLLLFWLSAGLYNPLLLNPVASVSYAALAALAALGSEQPAPEHTRQTV